MWKRSVSKVYQGVTREKVWDLLTDVNNWHTWHDDLEYCKMTESFQNGASFILKPKGFAPAAKLVLSDVKRGYSFTDCTTFFGARMYNIHLLEDTKEGLRLTNITKVEGWLSWLWVKIVAQNVVNGIEQEFDALVERARK